MIPYKIMALEFKTDRLWLLNHEKWLVDQYIKASLSYQQVFEVKTPYRMASIESALTLVLNEDID